MSDAATTKPLWKTLGFWIAFAMTNVGLLMSGGLLLEGTIAQVVGWIMTIATALGYKALPAPAQKPETVA